MRAGTENVLEITGFGKAAKIFSENSKIIINNQLDLRNRFFEQLQNKLTDIKINGDKFLRLPNTANIYFPKCNANTILAKIPEIAASSGATC